MTRRKMMLALVVMAPVSLMASPPRVAVAHFEYATVRSLVIEIFGSDVDLGKGIADMVETKLVASGQFRVYERRRMGVVMGEQEDSNSARFDPRTAVKVGQLTGAEYALLGSITRLGRDDRRKGVNVGAWIGRWVPSGNLTIGKGKAKAVVGLTLKSLHPYADAMAELDPMLDYSLSSLTTLDCLLDCTTEEHNRSGPRRDMTPPPQTGAFPARALLSPTSTAEDGQKGGTTNVD